MRDPIVWKKLLKSTARILLVSLGVVAAVGISFLFTGGFSSTTFSDRTFLAAIAIMVTGVLVLLAMAVPQQSIGIPTSAEKARETRERAVQKLQERFQNESRYNISIQMWLVGVVCIVMSALVQIILSNFGM